MNSLITIPHNSSGARLAPVEHSPFDPQESGPDRLDIRWLITVFNRRRLLFSCIFLVILALAVAFTFTRVPMYTGQATVTIDTHQLQLIPAPGSPGQSSAGDSTDVGAVNTQVEIIQSRTLADRVIRSLKLDENPEFVDRKKGRVGIRGQIMAQLAKLFGVPDTKKVPTADEIHQGVIDQVLSNLDVERVGVSYVISINYSDPDPDLAAQIANAFAAAYLNESVEAKLQIAQQASGQLSGRLRELSEQASRDAAAVEQYKIAHGLMSASGTTLTEQEIANGNQQLATARAQAAEDTARLLTAQQQLARGSTGEDVGEALDSGVVGALRGQRAQVSGHLADLAGRYGPLHPERLKAQRQLDDIDAQIKAEIHRIISNLQAKAEVSRQRVASMEGSLNQSKGTLAANNEAQVGLSELQQRAAASQALYDSYLSRYKEVSTSVGSEQSDSILVSSAKVPDGPSSPKVLLNIAVGLVLGLAAGLAATVVAEALDSSFTTGDDVERRVHATYLGGVPLLSSVAPQTKLSPARYAVEKPLSIYAESFRNLRVSLIYSAAGPSKVIGVTSALMNEGKTTTSVCLAQTSAIQGAKTVVVDCDLRRRTILHYLAEKPLVGLLEVISGKATLDEALIYDAKTGAAFLPLAQGGDAHDDVLGSAGMDRALEELRERFDLVILDTAPLLILSDARALAAKCDAVVLLARWRKTPEAAVKSALRLLHSSGANVAGVVLTKVDARRQAPYGYDGAGYYVAASKDYFR